MKLNSKCIDSVLTTPNLIFLVKFENLYAFSVRMIMRFCLTTCVVRLFLSSQDVTQIWRVADRLQSGMVGANETLTFNSSVPMGGIKQLKWTWY